jgi:beta-glucosidase
MTRIAFPEDFLWGSATSSFQIEGAAFEDGRGVSIWDTFCRTPGKVANGDTGDIACDHYHRYQQDVDLMAGLGFDMYRFSIAWPRILPQGTGQVNEAGLDFYDRLVDALLAKNIQPFATLYHWDLPQALQDAGGWPNRMIVDAFVNYADVVTKRLGDRVQNWMTLNEPWCISFLSHAIGAHAPGHQDIEEALLAAHHVLLAHGRSVPVIRANGNANTKVGIVLNQTWADPSTNSTEDIAAANRWQGHFNRWFLDPLYKGEYPEDMIAVYGGEVPDLQAGDLAEISVPTDFLGINFYNRAVVSNGTETPVLNIRFERPEGEYTAIGWEVYPESLYQLLNWIHKEYAPGPMYITENGAAYDDVVSPDGSVSDPGRLAYLQGHFHSAYRAMQDGVPLKGYFVWSLMDNFEWAEGYDKRFGIIYVDFETQQRIPKQSAHWFAQVIRDNGFEA